MKTWIFLIFVLALFSCESVENDNTKLNFAEGSTESINLWIQDSLKRYYYWSEEIPKSLDYSLLTKDFFRSLLSPGDRFSNILNTNDPTTFVNTTRSLYGFDYSFLERNGKCFLIVKLVLKKSPAERSGLQRGQIITKINGIFINSGKNSFAESMMTQSSSPLKLSVGTWENENIVNESDIIIYRSFTFDQPLESKKFEKKGKKIGYLYIYSFMSGISSELVDKFSEFKSKGVTDLIVDLRYNYGGSVAASATLCAMIPSKISENSPFIIYKGNRNGGEVKLSFAQQIALDQGSLTFSTLYLQNLGLKKVYILTTKCTASVSEIVVNNLKPYMKVIQIGEKTKRKDMSGWDIEDKRNPQKISWHMHPMIYKLYNSDNKGDYNKGIVPEELVDEFSTLPIKALGDSQETLIAAALENIVL